MLVIVALSPLCACSASDSPTDVFQFQIAPYHQVTTNITTFWRLGYGYSPDKSSSTYNLRLPAFSYTAASWFQIWAGLDTYYTDNDDSADEIEIRPWVGPKFDFETRLKWHIYDFTRYEFRDTLDLDSHHWSGVHRLRSRVGLEIPLASQERAWKQGTLYGLVYVEPFFRFDTHKFDPVDVSGGLGYIISDRLRVELIYIAGFAQSGTHSSVLDYGRNTIRLTLKVGLARGILDRMNNLREEK